VFRLTLFLSLPVLLSAQAVLENTGKPIQLPFECTAADSEAFGLSCSEEQPCPVYLELTGADAAGDRIFLTGNLHAPSATMYSILLSSEDAGKTWTEPQPRMKSIGFDQVQFLDFGTGYISGANLTTAPRDPFLLTTTDGGKSWQQRPVYEDGRVASIERFRFDSPNVGLMLIDGRLDNGRYELLETINGGESWTSKQAADKPIPFPAKAGTAPSLRLRADAATHSYAIERVGGDRGQPIVHFAINVGACKE
jgi:hypothetical protein